MRKGVKKAATLALLAVMSATSFGQAASALNLNDLVRYYLGTGPTGNVAPNQTLIRSNFDLRAQQLDAEITASLNAGRISASTASSLRAELDQLKSLFQVTYAVGGYTYGEVNEVVNGFGTLTNRLQTLASGGFGGGGGINTGINAKQQELRNKIAQALSTGRISQSQAQALRFSLQWTARLEADYRASGGFTENERQTIMASLGRVEARLNQWTGVAGGGTDTTGLSGKRSQVQSRLNEAVSLGRITADQASSIRYSLSWLADFQTDLSADGLSSLEVDRIASAYDRVLDRLNSWMTVAGVPNNSVNMQLSQLESKINNAIASGDLNFSQRLNLTSSLSYLKERAATMRADGLTQTEVNMILSDISRISARVDTYIADTSDNFWY